MVRHFILCIDDESDFWSSSKHSIHCVRSKKSILSGLESLTDDLLWFLNPQTNRLIAVATYVKHVKREVGPVLALTMSNEELGLSPTNESDYEVHYNTLYDIRECGITTEKKRKCSLWLDESNELAINYENLKRFSKAVFKGASAPAVCAKAIVTFDSVLYKKTEHCKMIHGDCGSFKQSYLHFESDAKAEEHAKMNGFRYFMRCKLTEGCTYWFLPDKVRRQDSRIATDPHDAAYNCVSWELC